MTTETLTETAGRPLHRFTGKQFDKLVAAGLVGEGLILLRGVVTVKGHYRDGKPVPYLFDVEQYDRMIELGILTPSDRVEFIHGRVVSRMGQNDPHGWTVEELHYLLQRALPTDFRVRSQLPVVLPENRPEPDLAVCASSRLRGRRHPRPGDVVIVIEVGDTSVQDDRTEMLSLYASVGIPVYWIVIIPDRRVEVYAVPGHLPTGEATYLQRLDYISGQAIPVVVAGTPVGAVPVDDILP